MSTTPDTLSGTTTISSPPAPDGTQANRAARPDVEDEQSSVGQRILVGAFVGVPMLALAAAIPFAWGWGLGWHDIVIAAVFYWLTGLGVTVGYHRYFTHGSFKAKKGLRVALAIAGSMAMQGPVITWVSDHRRHHKYSDKEGDPHSPWRYGEDWKALTKGLLYAHMLWLFDPNKTSQEKFSPDLLADSKIKKVDAAFGPLVAASLLLPALIGGLWGCPGMARSPRSSGPAWCGSRCCTTSPGRSTRSATRSATRTSKSATGRGTSPGWPSRRSASRGTTCTTRTRPVPGTARSRGRSTRAPG